MTSPASLPLVITMGDPAGCGPQITVRAWEQLRNDPNLRAFVIGDPKLYETSAEVAQISESAQAFDVWPHALPVLPLATDSQTVVAGIPDSCHAPAITKSIEQAVELALNEKACAIITNPISKAVLYQAGFTHPGHTEFLAELCACGGRPPRPVMMLVGGGLRVALATIHIPLMSVGRTLSQELLMEVAAIAHSDLIAKFGIASPRIAFTGLNPHAGEIGTIGHEELEIINPAAESLRKRGINITDARPADTVFAEARDNRFDAIIAMTHDQGLIPVKTLDLWGGVNCTLGLPIIRTSPDHGTAYEAAAAGNARPDSLIAAIKLAADMAAQA